jgi:hypothetical protein
MDNDHTQAQKQTPRSAAPHLCRLFQLIHARAHNSKGIEKQYVKTSAPLFTLGPIQ